VEEHTKAGRNWDPHLRSTAAVAGYKIEAKDGAIGHVEDFVMMTKPGRFAISSSIHGTGGRESGCSLHRNGLNVSAGVNRESSSISPVRLSKQSPEFTDESALTRDYDDALHRHYNRLGYWADEATDRPQLR